MPKTSLGLTPSPPAYKDILQLSELYLGGQPLVANRIISFLNPADLCSSLQVCTTWNLQVSCDVQFMNQVSTYCRQCKENAENLHKTEEPMETTVSPNKRTPLADFTPNTQSQLQTAKPAFLPHSLVSAWSPGSRGRTVGQWTPAKDFGSLRPSVAQRRARRGCAGCELRLV